MTQKTTVVQPPSSEELWAAYDGLKEQEEELRESWLSLNAEHQVASRAASEVFHRSSEAWDAYRSVCEYRTELYESAREAERSRRPGSVTVG